VSVLGDGPERAATLDGLRSAHGYLQSRVARELRLKHTPTLDFEYDQSIDHGMRITELLHSMPPPEEPAQDAQDAEDVEDEDA
jgi:ribosome-binding factor A